MVGPTPETSVFSLDGPNRVGTPDWDLYLKRREGENRTEIVSVESITESRRGRTTERDVVGEGESKRKKECKKVNFF